MRGGRRSVNKLPAIPGKDIFFIFSVSAICCLSGYFIKDDVADADKGARALIIIASFILSLILLVFYQRKLSANKVSVAFGAIAIYGVFISCINHRGVDSVSYFLRIISFAIFIQISYRQAIRKVSWHRTVSYIFIVMLVTYVLQIASDQLAGRVIFQNGAYRHSGNIGSPIGFATTLAVLLIGLLYFWMRSKRVIFLVLSIVASACILATATRSISLLSAFLIWIALFLQKSTSRKIILILITPAVVIFIVSMLSYDVGLYDRINGTLSYGELDNSSEFRFLILNTYFSNIKFSEIVRGLGLGSFPVWFYQQTNIKGVAPHFEWLWLISEFGVLIFALYFFVVIKMVVFVAKKHADASSLFLGLCMLTSHQLVFQFSNPFYFYQAYIPFALIFGLFLAELKNKKYYSNRI